MGGALVERELEMAIQKKASRTAARGIFDDRILRTAITGGCPDL